MQYTKYIVQFLLLYLPSFFFFVSVFQLSREKCLFVGPGDDRMHLYVAVLFHMACMARVSVGRLL